MEDQNDDQLPKYNVSNTGPVQGQVIGDHNQITQNFGEDSRIAALKERNEELEKKIIPSHTKALKQARDDARIRRNLKQTNQTVKIDPQIIFIAVGGLVVAGIAASITPILGLVALVVTAGFAANQYSTNQPQSNTENITSEIDRLEKEIANAEAEISSNKEEIAHLRQ